MDWRSHAVSYGDAVNARGEVCFDLQKPIIGRPPGRVCISDFGEVHVEHRLLKAPVVFSIDRILAFCEASEAVQSALPALEREPRWVHLPRDGFTSANVAFVFRAPVHVGPFKRGANQLIPLGRGERRDGIDVDLLTTTIDDPGHLAAAMRGLGVSSSADLGTSLARAIPVVPPELEAEVFERRRRATRGTARKTVGVGLLMAGLTGARAAADGAWGTMARVTLASVAAAVIIGVALLLRPGRSADSRRSSLRWAGPAIASVIALVCLGIALGAGDSVGAEYLLMWAALGGVVGGYLVGKGLRGLAATRVQRPGGDPLAQPGRRWGAGAVAVTVSVALIAAAAAMEQSAAKVIEGVRAALVDQGDLPPGWSGCCGGDHVLRGDVLDSHICGSDDRALPRHEAAVARPFNLVVPGHPDLSNAHFEQTILLAPSVSDAVAEFEAIDSVDYVECTGVSIGKTASQFQPNAVDVAAADYLGRETISGLSDVVIDHFHIRIPIGGTFDAIEGYFVRGRVGRAILRLPILVYVQEKVNMAQRDAVVRAAVIRLDAANL